MVQRADAPGGVLLVQTPNGVWRGATGSSLVPRSIGGPQGARRSPMRVTLRFRVASVTKMFTAALVLRLVEEGRLALGDTVERWLPGRLPSAGSIITIEQLLGHRSGIRNAGTPDGPMVVAGSPGSFYYANANYGLLGEVIAAATGSTYAEGLSSRILRPLGLSRTELSLGRVPAGLAHGYSLPLTPTDKRRLDLTAMPETLPPAAAGLVSNASDLARFERLLLRGNVTSADFVRLMRTPASVAGYDTHGYTAYGLGLMRFPASCGAAWGHRGRVNGYISYVLATADGKRTAVLLLNVNVTEAPSWAVLAALNKLATRALCL